MNYLKLMSILSEKDASEYKIKKNTKKDDRADYERSKADKEFKDLHKVDVTSEDELDSPGYKVTTKHVGDHKGNPSATNTFDGPIKHNSDLKKYDMGGFGKSSARQIDKNVGDKTFNKVEEMNIDEAAVKPLSKRQKDARLMRAGGMSMKAYREKWKLPGGNDTPAKKKQRTADIDRVMAMQKEASESKSKPTRSAYEKSRKEAQKNIDTFRAAQKTKTKTTAESREINELSKKTLGSYISKASKNMSGIALSKQSNLGTGRTPPVRTGTKATAHLNKPKPYINSTKVRNKIKKRDAGIQTAVGKLTKTPGDKKKGTGLYYEPDKRLGPKAYGEATEASHIAEEPYGEHKVGAKVVAKKGPHKGQVHTVIHKYAGQNKYNIRPDVHPSTNKYPQGAATASGEHLTAHAGRRKG